MHTAIAAAYVVRLYAHLSCLPCSTLSTVRWIPLQTCNCAGGDESLLPPVPNADLLVPPASPEGLITAEEGGS